MTHEQIRAALEWAATSDDDPTAVLQTYSEHHCKEASAQMPENTDRVAPAVVESTHGVNDIDSFYDPFNLFGDSDNDSSATEPGTWDGVHKASLGEDAEGYLTAACSHLILHKRQYLAL